VSGLCQRCEIIIKECEWPRLALKDGYRASIS
jgi:hypothetical protein